MSDLLRSAWLAGSMCKSLVAWRTKKGSAKPPQEYSISPDGDLLLRGTKEGLLQLTKFLTYEDPLTAQLSDKYFYIDCEFTPTCRSWFDEEHGKDLLKIKGALIQLLEYEVRFAGSDGALSEKGIAFAGQLATKEARASGTRKSLTGSSTRNPPQIPQIPIPVFVIQKFVLLASEGERIWGTPKTIMAHTKLQGLLADLPRRRISVVGRNGDKDKELPRLAQQVPGAATTGRREVVRDQDDEEDDDDEDEDSQPFATQALNKFSYFDDLDFETQSPFRAGAPTGSRPSDSLPSSLRVPQKNSRPLKRKEVSFEVPSEKSAIQPKVQRVAKLRKSQGGDALGHSGTNGSLVLHLGWQGMVEVTEEDSTIPEDQKMAFEKEEAWYPFRPRDSCSPAYNIQRDQAVLEMHRRGGIYFGKHTARKTCLTQQKPPSDPAESEDTESGVSWPSSPEYQEPRFVGRDVTRTPPHSSMMSHILMRSLGPSTSQAPKERSSSSILGTPVESGDSFSLPKNGGSQKLASNKKPRKRKKTSGSSLASNKHSSPGLCGGPSKRVTRGANGISKRVLPDPTNSVFKRPRKPPNLKKYDSDDDFEDHEEVDYSDQSSGSRTREFSVEPPFPVIDPDGRTRVAKYGILGAQQVEIWDRNRKLAKTSNASSGPVDEDNSFSDASFPDPDILEDLATFKSNGGHGTEGGFSQFVVNLPHEKDLHFTPCDVPPSLESNPMQSLLLSNHDSDTIGGRSAGHSFGGGSEPRVAPLEAGHNKETNMSDDENDMPQHPSPLPSRAAFAVTSSAAAEQGDGQKEAVLSRELSANPTKPPYGDPELDKGKGLSRLEGAPRNGSALVAGRQVSLGAEACSLQFIQSKPDLKEMYHSSSPIPAATVQVKETPCRGDGRPLLARERAVYMNDDSDQEGILGTEDPLSTVQVPDSSQDQLLRENQEYRANLEVQVPASSDGVRVQKSQTPATLSRVGEGVPSSSDEIRRSEKAGILKTLEKPGKVLTDSPISKQSAEHIAPPFSPTTNTDKGPKIALSILVPRAPSPELTNLEPPASVRTEAAGIIDISSDEEVPAPAPSKPVNLLEYLRVNRAIRDGILARKEQLKPEMYAGIRSRSLRIPGQEDRTEAEKKSEDEKRKKYFGTNQARPWNDPWKPVGELARLERDRLEKEAKLEKDSPPKPLTRLRGASAAEDWFRDPDTPVKVFLRKLKKLKQVENDAAGIGAEGTHAGE